MALSTVLQIVDCETETWIERNSNNNTPLERPQRRSPGLMASAVAVSNSPDANPAFYTWRSFCSANKRNPINARVEDYHFGEIVTKYVHNSNVDVLANAATGVYVTRHDCILNIKHSNVEENGKAPRGGKPRSRDILYWIILNRRIESERMFNKSFKDRRRCTYVHIMCCNETLKLSDISQVRPIPQCEVSANMKSRLPTGIH